MNRRRLCTSGGRTRVSEMDVYIYIHISNGEREYKVERTVGGKGIFAREKDASTRRRETEEVAKERGR